MDVRCGLAAVHPGSRPSSRSTISRWRTGVAAVTLTVVGVSDTAFWASGGPQPAKLSGTVGASLPSTSTWNGALPTSNDSVPVAGAASVSASPTPALPLISERA